MLIKEYRITMPVSLEEYKIGQLYTVSQASLNETGGGEGVEVITNESFDNFPLFEGQYSSGQYTFKKYHLDSRVPAFIRWIAPKGSLEIHEEAWNAFPYCRTIITNPPYMAEGFRIVIESMHLDNDRGTANNVHHLPANQLSEREVIELNITEDVPATSSSDYQLALDPTKFHSTKTGRGPLQPNYKSTCQPVMTCYKLVSAEFKWLGFQNRMEKFIHRQEKRVFQAFHRKLFCWIDTWHDMTIPEIRALEERTRRELDEARATGRIIGMKADGDVNG